MNNAIHFLPTLTKANTPIFTAAVGAIGSVVVASIAAMSAYFSSKRERRRNMYGEAFKAAMAWLEMLYKVRRRADTAAARQELVGRFHELQESINFYGGWMGSESPWMRRSYQSLVSAIKTATAPKIREAWGAKPQPPTAVAPKGDPDLSAATSAFLFDVRCHIAWWQLPKILVVMRNRRWFRRKAR